MDHNLAAEKLKERVSDWQSYLGRSDYPLGSAPPTFPATPFAFPEVARAQPEDIGAAPELVKPQDDVSDSSVVPPMEAAVTVDEASPKQSGTRPSPVVEVLPPENSPRFDRAQRGARRSSRSPHRETQRKGVLFQDSQRAEAEYHHARRANLVLTSFIILLLGVLFTVVSWLIVD